MSTGNVNDAILQQLQRARAVLIGDNQLDSLPL